MPTTTLLSLLLLIGWSRLSISVPSPQQSTTLLVSSMRRNLYTNLTCPINCTCSSYQQSGGGRQSSAASSSSTSSTSSRSVQPQYDTLSPKQSVDCDQISLDNIRDLFAYLPEGVTSFSLRRAGLTSLVDLCCMDDLESLDLSENRISDLIVYVEFEKLTFLNLRGNALRILRKDEFISFPNVEILNVDSNDVQMIDQESFRLMRLRELYLSQNKITYVNERAFRYAANLELLNLSGNRLTTLHARNFYFSRKLRSLDSSTNQLSHVDEDAFEPLYRLEELNLAFNNLTTVPTVALQKLSSSLRSLTLDGNPFTVFDNGSFSRLAALETLRLDQLAELSVIMDGAFSDLPRLRRLSICGCRRLQYLSPRMFAGDRMSALSELYLTNNGLSFVPSTVANLATLTKLDMSGNPFECECMRRVVRRILGDNRKKPSSPFEPTCRTNDQRTESLFSGSWMVAKSRSSECIPTTVPSVNTNLTRPIGASIALHCSIIDGSDGDFDEPEYRVVWILPSGRRVTAGEPRTARDRIDVDHERLHVAFLLHEDSGRYTCTVAKVNGSTTATDGDPSPLNIRRRTVDLRVDSMASVIIPVDVSAYYVTWSWSHATSASSSSFSHKTTSNNNHLAPLALSRHHRPSAPPGDCRLSFKSENDPEFVHIDLPSSWERYTVTRLRPETNYSFCLIYTREEIALYKYCTSVRTERAYLHFGVSLNYSLIALLAVSISLICALCVARCVNKRLHIWQEEKYRGRMQESLSAQGFLSSFESLTSGSLATACGSSSAAAAAAAAANSAVTYENHGALDSISQNGEEAETTLDEPSATMAAIVATRAAACRRNPRNLNRRSTSDRHSPTIIVETHADA